MDEIIKQCKKFLPAKLRIVRSDDTDRTFAVPNIRNRWQHVTDQMRGESFVRVELLDKKGDVLATMDREEGTQLGAMPNLGQGLNQPGLGEQAGGLGVLLHALAGLGNMMLAAVRFGMEEQRKGNTETLGHALDVLKVTSARLEGWEKSAEKLMKLAFDTTRHAAALEGGGDPEGTSGPMLQQVLEMVQGGREEAIREEVAKRVAEERKKAAGSQPAAGANGAKPPNGASGVTP